MVDFVTSDPHFGHQGVCEFLTDTGEKVRPWDNAEEMNEELVRRHNSVVSNSDKVYYLGDIAFNKKNLSILDRLNGKKVLIKGNHDQEKIQEYLKYFYDVRGVHVYKKFLMSHIPIHPDSLGRFRGNIHGHLHTNRLLLPSGEIDTRYISACVECTDFTPISFEDLEQRFINQKNQINS